MPEENYYKSLLSEEEIKQLNRIANKEDIDTLKDVIKSQNFWKGLMGRVRAIALFVSLMIGTYLASESIIVKWLQSGGSIPPGVN